jgi:hypothetical protein
VRRPTVICRLSRRSMTSLAAIVLVAGPGLLVAGCTSRVTRAAVASDASLAADAPPAQLRPSSPQDSSPGLRLLQQAVQAVSDVSYQGVEMVSSSGANGNTTLVANVWHRSGGSTVIQSGSDGAAAPTQARAVSVSDDTDPQAPCSA